MRNFKKKFVTFILIFLALSIKSFAEIINKVEVKGNERITLETIVIFGDITIGKNYESSDINLIIKKLYETNFFSDISVELQNGKLNILVKENPVINTVTFKGEKAEKFKTAIREKLVLREKTSFLENYINSDINVIKTFYKQLGFYFVTIDLDIEDLKRNRVNLIYSINKGEKAKISKIYFLGDKKIRDKRLRDVITSEEAKVWKFLTKNIYLNKDRIELDKRLLKNYYRNKGYYEVDITSSSVEYVEGKDMYEGFILTFSINAGKRYKFKKIYTNVAKALDQTAFLPLEGYFNEIIGEYYSQQKLTSILEKIDKLSQQKELQFINHRTIETLDGDGIEVEINIFEGQKFTIERIDIAGNSVTNDSVIRGEMLIDEGDPYSALLINKSVNKLKARGIFGKVEQKIKEGSSPDLKVLELTVEEKATGELAAGLGVGTDGTSFFFSVSENNWLGRGIKFSSQLDLTEETVSGSISVDNPNYKATGNSAHASLYISTADKTVSSGYKSSKSGFGLGTGFEQYENIYFTPSISAAYEDIETESTASAAIKKMEGTFTNMDFKYGITIDKRNQVYQPTAGFWANFNQTLPIILDSSSLMQGLKMRAYHAFSEDVVGVGKFYARSIYGIDEDVRITKRLYIPQSRLRGFKSSRVGPKDGSDWIGGNYTTALGFEAQLPNLLPEATRTDVSVFFDSANVWGVDYSDTLDDGSALRSSVGLAANIFTPVGPLSFILAEGITKGSNDATERFHFRLGTSF